MIFKAMVVIALFGTVLQLNAIGRDLWRIANHLTKSDAADELLAGAEKLAAKHREAAP